VSRSIHGFDRAFSLLGCKTDPGYGMVDSIEDSPKTQLRAERIRSDYFEIRFYKGIGTVHFSPTRRDLIDRVNRIVGQRRQWLPTPQETVPEDFWLQYDAADKVAHEVDKG